MSEHQELKPMSIKCYNNIEQFLNQSKTIKDPNIIIHSAVWADPSSCFPPFFPDLFIANKILNKNTYHNNRFLCTICYILNRYRSVTLLSVQHSRKVSTSILQTVFQRKDE